MRTFLPALVAAAIATGTALPAADVSPRELQRATAASVQGFQALQQGDLSRASQLFEEALTSVPGFPNARVGLGHVAYARRQYEAALNHYTGARDEISRLQDDVLNAEFLSHEDAQRKILKYEDDIRTLESLPGADVATQVRELQRAIEEMRRVHAPVRSEPVHPPAEIYYHRGNALFQLGRIDEAIADWETCARFAPKFGAVHNNLAVAHWKLGQLLLARDELAMARELGVKVDPEFEKTLLGTGTAPPPPQ